MDRISGVFSEGRKVLVVYLTAGFPEPGADEELARVAAASGADILELGFPFSDPVADGPLIQEASARALANGMTLAGTLQLAARVRAESAVPILLMGYANPVHRMGYEVFASRLEEVGADGAIIPDLPMEANAPLLEPMRARHLALVPMAAPNTPERRLKPLMDSGDGFLYLVSMTGLTGDVMGDASYRKVAEAAARSGRLPVCVGFGIRTPEDAARAAEVADGVVVGSAVTKVIAESSNGEMAVAGVGKLVKQLAQAIK